MNTVSTKKVLTQSNDHKKKTGLNTAMIVAVVGRYMISLNAQGSYRFLKDWRSFGTFKGLFQVWKKCEKMN